MKIASSILLSFLHGIRKHGTRKHGTRKGCHYYTTLERPLTVYSSRSPMYRGTRACPCHARHLRSKQKMKRTQGNNFGCLALGHLIYSSLTRLNALVATPLPRIDMRYRFPAYRKE